MLTKFSASATTCAISPGEEKRDDQGVLHISNRAFTDIVESSDPRVAGSNEPILNLDIDTSSGEAILSGIFTLAPSAGAGSWRGELQGRIADGLVKAFGVARGDGELEGAVLAVEFRQVLELDHPASCPEPKAFFQMEGWILDH